MDDAYVPIATIHVFPADHELGDEWERVDQGQVTLSKKEYADLWFAFTQAEVNYGEGEDWFTLPYVGMHAHPDFKIVLKVRNG